MTIGAKAERPSHTGPSRAGLIISLRRPVPRNLITFFLSGATEATALFYAAPQLHETGAGLYALPLC